MILKAEIIYGDSQTKIDFCDSWENIGNKLKKEFNECHFYGFKKSSDFGSIQFIKVSGDAYKKLAEIISEDDTVYDIGLACKKLQYGDKEFVKSFEKNWKKYHSARDVDDAYIKFIQTKEDSMTPQQEKVFDADPHNWYFELIKLYGTPVLYTPGRIQNDNIPKGMHLYEVRSDDEGEGIMCELSKRIMVNRWGTILSNKPIALDKDGYRDIDEDKDVEYMIAPAMTIKEYQAEYPTIKQKER